MFEVYDLRITIIIYFLFYQLNKNLQYIFARFNLGTSDDQPIPKKPKSKQLSPKSKHELILEYSKLSSSAYSGQKGQIKALGI